MIHNRFCSWTWIISICLWAGLSACHRDELPIVEEEEEEVLPNDLNIEAISNPWKIATSNDQYSFRVNYNRCWKATADAEWITFDYDKECGDGYVRFNVKENTQPFAREAYITVTDTKDPELVSILRIRQLGTESEDNATLSEDMQRKHGMGWGYNIMGSYADDDSFSSSPVFDYTQLVKSEEKYGLSLVTEDRRFYEKIDIYSSHTLTELSNQMSSSETSGGFILGCGKEVTNSTSIFTQATSTEDFGFVRMAQIVASRTLDIGNLKALITTPNSPILSKEFRSNVQALEQGSMSADEFIARFGTHLVVSADLGGKLDLSIRIKRETVVEITEAVKTIVKKIFGRVTSTSNHYVREEQENTIIDYKAQLKCSGGSVETQNVLKQYSNGQSAIPAANIKNWQSSFNGKIGSNNYNVRLINCRLIPISEFVMNEGLKEQINAAIEKKAGDKAFKAPVINEKIYRISTKKIKEETKREKCSCFFSDYYGEVFLLEVTPEYVTAIRKDKLVKVIYPIINNRFSPYTGIFLGDEDSKPGYVQWAQGKSFYTPLEDGTPIDSIYIQGGILSIENFNKKNTEEIIHSYDESVKILPYTPSDHYYSFVKFGAEHWIDLPSTIDPRKENIAQNKEIQSKLKYFNLVTEKNIENMMRIFNNKLSLLCSGSPIELYYLDWYWNIDHSLSLLPIRMNDQKAFYYYPSIETGRYVTPKDTEWQMLQHYVYYVLPKNREIKP